LRVLAGEEVPAGFGAGPAVLLDVRLLLRGRQLRPLARVDADGDDFVVGPHLVIDTLQSFEKAAQHHRAEARAAVVGEDQHHRLAIVEVVAQHFRAALLVPEREVERHLLVEALLDARFGHGRIERFLRVGGGSDQDRQEGECRRGQSGWNPAIAGSQKR
jgi:hypothetical protein